MDGSEGATSALRWAAAEARLREAPLSVVHAWTVPFILTSPSADPSAEPFGIPEPAHSMEEVRAAAREKAEETVGAAAQAIAGEGTAILLVVVPVLLPTALALGVDPVHFGIVAVMNIMIGLVTPPYGLLLFMMVKIANVRLADLVREVMPFLGVMVGALALITLVPDLVLFLPRLLGYKG